MKSIFLKCAAGRSAASIRRCASGHTAISLSLSRSPSSFRLSTSGSSPGRRPAPPCCELSSSCSWTILSPPRKCAGLATTSDQYLSSISAAVRRGQPRRHAGAGERVDHPPGRRDNDARRAQYNRNNGPVARCSIRRIQTRWPKFGCHQ